MTEDLIEKFQCLFFILTMNFCNSSSSCLMVCPGEFGLQPEPSLVLSQLVQRHTGPSLSLGRQPSPPSQQQQHQAAPTSASPASQHVGGPAQTGPVMAAAAAAKAAGAGLDPQGSSTQQQQQRAQLKGQKRRIPPTSKVWKRLKAPSTCF